MGKLEKTARKAKPPRRPGRVRLWWNQMDPDRRRGAFFLVGWVILGVFAATGSVIGMRTLQQRVVLQRYAGAAGAATVRVTAVPDWMPASLAKYVTEMITPPNANLSDPELAHKVYDLAADGAKNPLVRKANRVEVRPSAKGSGGVVEVDLEFRQPFARIRLGADHLYVDREGFCLPAELVPMYVLSIRDNQTRAVRQVCYQALGEVPEAWRSYARPIHYVTIDGVQESPPKPGAKWPAADLGAGLKLIELISTKPYYAQINVVDVRNHAGRITRNEPELRMYAQVGAGRPTDIRFGRFPKQGSDWVVSPQQKIGNLDGYAANHNGLLAGINTYLDLRYGNLHVSLN
jgi:hypothetical protein